MGLGNYHAKTLYTPSNKNEKPSYKPKQKTSGFYSFLLLESEDTSLHLLVYSKQLAQLEQTVSTQVLLTNIKTNLGDTSFIFVDLCFHSNRLFPPFSCLPAATPPPSIN
jgi:hypothetical protein